MGHNLRLSVVSEGIEEAGEAALMREFRSQYGQGYLFSRPVDAATLDRLLADGTNLDGGAMKTGHSHRPRWPPPASGSPRHRRGARRAALRRQRAGERPDNSGATLRQSGPFSGTPLGPGTLNVTTAVGRGQRRPGELHDVQPARPVWGIGDVKLRFRGSMVIL